MKFCCSSLSYVQQCKHSVVFDHTKTGKVGQSGDLDNVVVKSDNTLELAKQWSVNHEWKWFCLMTC